MLLLLLGLASAAKFGFTSKDDVIWLQVNVSHEFAFHVIADGESADAVEATLRSERIEPYVFGGDTTTVMYATLTPNYTDDEWGFSFEGQKEGEFCYGVRPNLKGSLEIDDSIVCFRVSGIATGSTSSFLGELANTKDDLFAEDKVVSITPIDTSRYTVLSALEVKMSGTLGAPFYSDTVTVISSNGFEDAWHIIFDLSTYPELIGNREVFRVCNNDDIIVLVQNNVYRLRQGEPTVVLEDGNCGDVVVGCTHDVCHCFFVSTDLSMYKFDDEDWQPLGGTYVDASFDIPINYDHLAVVVKNETDEFFVQTFVYRNENYVEQLRVTLPAEVPDSAHIYEKPPLVNDESQFEESISLSIVGIHTHLSKIGRAHV